MGGSNLEICDMASPPRPIAFILASTDHGAMILNRYDQRIIRPGEGYGVGFSLLNRSKFDESEVALVTQLLDMRRQHFGDGVMALDLGANIGVFTIEWARHMTGWGSILAVEAQERIFHALAGNVAINNCFNARPAICAFQCRTTWRRLPLAACRSVPRPPPTISDRRLTIPRTG
jgi:hypothetical protein